MYSKKSTMSENYCKYCLKQFRFKDLYEQHTVTCEFFYKKARERDREIDLHETLPTAREQYQLVQHLMLEVTTLRKEVIRLKQNNIVRKKKMISEYLNSATYPKPGLPFDDWMRQIPTSSDNLQRVFDGDLTDGVEHVLRTVVQQNASIPICAFTQKAATFYIYTSGKEEDGDPKWIIMPPDEYLRLYRRISHKLLQEFLRWQLAHEEDFQNSPALKEKNIEYMCKISGVASGYEDRRKAECKKWLFNLLAKDFAHNIDYEYV